MLFSRPNPPWWHQSNSWLQLGDVRRLHLSRAGVLVDRNIVGLDIAKLEPFAENELEKAAVYFFSRAAPGILHKSGDPFRGLFLFKCFLVPCFSGVLVGRFNNSADSPPQWLAVAAASIAGFERTVKERSCLFEYQLALKGTKGHAAKRFYPSAHWRRKPISKWFDDAPEGYLFWIERYCRWRAAALASFRFYLEKQSRDIKVLKGDQKKAAILALIGESGCPYEIYQEALHKYLSDSELQKIFQKNRKKRPNNPPNLAIKTWLIEIWPLVTEYGWNYLDVQRAANEHFEELPIIGETLCRIKELCKSLSLRLGTIGRSRSGRPPGTADAEPGESEVSRLPCLCEVAAWVESLGEDPPDWFCGQTGVFDPR